MTPELIVALDVPDAKGAIPLVTRLGDACGFYKVGSELFTASGPGVVEALRTAGKEVFLDLKFHDIPNTVRSAARSAAKLGVRLITVHASGGSAMLEAAREGAGEHTKVLAVTILTSLDAGAVGRVWGRSVERIEEEVLRLSDLAVEAGVHGIVCGGRRRPGCARVMVTRWRCSFRGSGWPATPATTRREPSPRRGRLARGRDTSCWGGR